MKFDNDQRLFRVEMEMMIKLGVDDDCKNQYKIAHLHKTNTG